jgi:hypothetical protein
MKARVPHCELKWDPPNKILYPALPISNWELEGVSVLE